MSELPEETKKDLKAMHGIDTDKEPDTLEPTMTYEEKIKGILNKVTNGEEVYPKEEFTPTQLSIKEHGVKGAILRVFNESVGDYTLNEEEKPYGENLFPVEPPSNYPDADTYWDKLIPQLRNIGDGSVNPNGKAKLHIGKSGEGREILNIALVRNEENGDKPSIYLSWDDADKMTEDEAKSILEKVGIGVERTVETDRGVVAEAIP
jgi:hypothetical protein